jgi:hypothetical protein
MLDQHALQFERADAVVARLEHVVVAADVEVIAVGVDAGGVAGVVMAAAHGIGGLGLVAFVAEHQAQRRGSRTMEISPSPPAVRRCRAARSGSPAAAGPSSRV